MKKIIAAFLIALFCLCTSASAIGVERFIILPAGTSYTEGDFSNFEGLQFWKQLPVYRGEGLWYMDTDIWNIEYIRVPGKKMPQQTNVWLRYVWEPKYNKQATLVKVGLVRRDKFAILEVKQYDKKGVLYEDKVVNNPIYYDIEPGSVFEALYDLYIHGDLKDSYGDKRLNDGTGIPPMAYSPWGSDYSYRWN